MTGLTRETILVNIYKDAKLREYATNITRGNQLTEDLLSCLYLHFSEMKEEKLTQLYSSEQFRFWAVRFMMNQYRSTTGDFHKMYKDFRVITYSSGINEEEITMNYELNTSMVNDFEAEMQIIEKEILPHLQHYEQIIFLELWTKDRKTTGKDISNRTGASYSFVKESIRNIKSKIKAEMKRRGYDVVN